MINIIYGKLEDENFVYDPNWYFDINYEPEWFNNELVREMIRDIDKSTVLEGEVIMSDVFGAIPPQKLSGGVKTLILLCFDNSRIFNISKCGDNCAKWIAKISEIYDNDIIVNLRHVMSFDGEFEFKILNSGTIVHNREEYLAAIFPYLHVGKVSTKDMIVYEG